MKLYVDEPGNEAVRDLDPLVVSCLARVEVPAAFWRKHRLDELDAPTAATLTADFEADYFGTGDEPARFISLALPAVVLDDAATIAATHGLRALDSLQLASARRARAADPACTRLACFDRDLRAAGHAEGFDVVPPL